jgi:hypothetical protein
LNQTQQQHPSLHSNGAGQYFVGDLQAVHCCCQFNQRNKIPASAYVQLASWIHPHATAAAAAAAAAAVVLSSGSQWCYGKLL